ncbi:hypothetical protein GOP47_0013782 [Adiantum capillus-veneris]|uniref:Uncharacterized protein n=1 Tax=Adiantum capillus-veneris TaxID=13818 RepID=A0A9D4ZG39_ADICA|nr:hypothetical protein GOP47_0013782 [Adiantum capillus-veneris]
MVAEGDDAAGLRFFSSECLPVLAGPDGREGLRNRQGSNMFYAMESCEQSGSDQLWGKWASRLKGDNFVS